MNIFEEFLNFNSDRKQVTCVAASRDNLSAIKSNIKKDVSVLSTDPVSNTQADAS